MDQTNLYSVLITIVTVLGSAAAFKFYDKRSIRKERDDDFIRHDCKDRISKLEALLMDSAQEKDEMRQQILDLVAEVASLRTEIRYLTDRRTGRNNKQ